MNNKMHPYFDFPAWKRKNENDREMVVTKVEDGIWIYIDGHNTMTTKDAARLDMSVIFIDTLHEDVVVHVWSDPDEEDPTHAITLKREGDNEMVK